MFRTFAGVWQVGCVIGIVSLLLPMTAQSQNRLSPATSPSVAPYIHIKVVDGLLQVDRTNLPNGQRRANMPGEYWETDGNLTVSIRRNEAGLVEAFSFARNVGDRKYQLSLIPHELSFSEMEVDHSKPYQIYELHQVYSNELGRVPGKPFLQLTAGVMQPGIRAWNGPGPIPGHFDVQVEAQSFDELCRDHPVEIEKYILPIFETFNIDLLGSQRDLEIDQVFSEAALDPATVDHAKSLIAALASDSLEKWQSATDNLAALGPPGTLVMLRTDPVTLTPVQLARVHGLCNGSRLLTADEIAALRNDPGFLSQCLLYGSHAVRVSALTALKHLMGRDFPFDVDASYDDRAASLEKFGLPRTDRP